MEKFSDDMNEMYVTGHTMVTMHNMHLQSSGKDDAGKRWITSCAGRVNQMTYSYNKDANTATVTMDVRLLPFPKYMRFKLPLFRFIESCPLNPDRTMYRDNEDIVFAQVTQHFDLNNPNPSVEFEGVSIGTKCTDNCLRKCYKHHIPHPYCWKV